MNRIVPEEVFIFIVLSFSLLLLPALAFFAVNASWSGEDFTRAIAVLISILLAGAYYTSSEKIKV